MHITIRHTADCPNVASAEQNVRAALVAVGKEARIQRELVESVEDAERLDFRGSPTILLDGVDPFEVREGPAALACRLYQTPDGPKGAPSTAQLREVLQGPG